MPKLTKRVVETAGHGRHYDTEIRGFGLYVGETGSPRSFFIEYRHGYGRAGRKRRMVIGRYGILTPHLAREEAVRLLAMVREGRDPLQEKRQPAGVTMANAADAWIVDLSSKRKPRTAKDYRRYLDKHVLPNLGSVPVSEISRTQMAKLHSAIGNTPSEANHCMRCLSSFFTWCEYHELRPVGSNPCKLVERYKESKRKRYLSAKELARLSRVLAIAEYRWPWSTSAIRLLLFSGMRMSEVLFLRWTDVDIDNRCLKLRDSKTGPKTIFLNDSAREVLAQIPRMTNTEFVICGHRKDGRLGDLERPWRRIRKAALIPDVRLHDLRHSFASAAVSGGVPLSTIAMLLGHSSIQMTERYAHLSDDPVRAAAELVGNAIKTRMNG